MREYLVDEDLPEFPKWLSGRTEHQRTNLKVYKNGQWTYSNGYVFFYYKNENYISYRKPILCRKDDLSTEWKYIDVDESFSLETNPIIYVMEDIL